MLGCGWFGRKGAGGQSSGVMGSLDGELGWICGFVDDVDLLACHFLVTVKMNKRPLLSVALPHQQSPCCRTAEPHSGGGGAPGPFPLAAPLGAHLGVHLGDTAGLCL